MSELLTVLMERGDASAALQDFAAHPSFPWTM